MTQVQTALRELFAAHGVEAEIEGDWIVFRRIKLRAAADVVKETSQAYGMSIQLDVRLEIGPGKTIVESFAGVGKTREQTEADALHNFALNSLHVMLAAFFDPSDTQVTQEQWMIANEEYRVTIGNVGVRGKATLEGEQWVEWFPRLQVAIKRQRLGPGTHWVRLYYSQMDGKALACEVLLDNDEWQPIQSEMAAMDWPSTADFYSFRIFLILQPSTGDVVTPKDAVTCLADFVAPHNGFTEDEAYAALAAAGVPTALADRAYKFTQTAWGRMFLLGIGVQFPPNYMGFNASGEVVETGRLDEEPCYIAATRLAERYGGSPGFIRLALMSADVNAVNNALHAGSKPENLAMSPAFLFLEAPTEQGLRNAQRTIDEQMAALARSTKIENPSIERPWWRFWG